MTLRFESLQAALCFGIALAARLAHADPSSAELSSARQAFESAVALEAEQKWAEAAAKLRQAVAIKDTPGLRFHLAHSEERQGLLLEAAADYDRASALLAEGAKAPDVQKLLVPASAELKRRIPHLSVQISPSEVSNPATRIDGKGYAPSELSQGIALNPGAHQLTVSASGYADFERAFALKEGEQMSLRAELKPSLAPSAPVSVVPPGSTPSTSTSAEAGRAAAVAPATPSGRTSLKPYLLVGESAITVAGLALGVGYALAESSARDRVLSAQARINVAAPNDPNACGSGDAPLTGACSDLRSAISDHDRDATVSTVGFVCAGVGAAALVTTWLAYPAQSQESSGISLTPVIALGRLGVQGRF